MSGNYRCIRPKGRRIAVPETGQLWIKGIQHVVPVSMGTAPQQIVITIWGTTARPVAAACQATNSAHPNVSSCGIKEPNVNQKFTEYKNMPFSPGDIVHGICRRVRSNRKWLKAVCESEKRKLRSALPRFDMDSRCHIRLGAHRRNYSRTTSCGEA